MQVRSIDFTSPQAPKEFSNSLRETGFAVIRQHPIPSLLIESTYKEWEKFFSNPEKEKYLFEPVSQAGYFPVGTENAKGYLAKDLKEFFHYFPKYGLPPSVSTYTPELRDRLNDLAAKLLSWLQSHLPNEISSKLSMPLEKMIEGSELTLFRPIHYPPLGKDLEEGAVRAAAHEDINLLTLLPAATEPGLEVRDLEGKWHAVPCDMGNIIVNAGDCLKLATKNYFISTTHRVINPVLREEAAKSRYSMPLFLHPRNDVLLSPTVTHEQYLDERLKEIGIRAK